MAFFSMDNWFFRTVGKLTDLVWVNILALICALPIVTAGASFSAMYYLLLRMADNDQGALTRGFFRAFRQNFKQATKAWLVILVLLGIYGYNFYLLRAGMLEAMGTMGKVSFGVVIAGLALILILSIYIFSLIARYENSLKVTVINALKLAFAFFPRSLCMAVIFFFPLALMFISDIFFWLWFLYGLAYPGYVIAMLMVRIFHKIEDVQEEAAEEKIRESAAEEE